MQFPLAAKLPRCRRQGIRIAAVGRDIVWWSGCPECPQLNGKERKKFQAELLIRLTAESEFALENPGQHIPQQLLQPWKESKLLLPHVQTLSLTSQSDK